MASSNLIVSIAISLVALPLLASGDLDFLGACDGVVCGKGTCKTGLGVAPYPYVCECDSGWRRTRLSDDGEQYLEFLPCLIPNCSMNYTCMPLTEPLAPPVTSPLDAWNLSFYDPCNWIYCGEGSCNKTSDHQHTCNCQTGSYNLLNISHHPCYKDCAIGSDCSNLGIKALTSNSTTGSNPSPIQGSGFMIRGKLSWTIAMILGTSVASFLWI